MSYRDWSQEDYSEFVESAEQDLFNQRPELQDLNDQQFFEAEALFQAGWLTFGEYSPEQLYAIRDQFYDLLNIQEQDFDWETYRELYDAI